MKNGKMILNFENNALAAGKDVVSLNGAHPRPIYCPFPYDYSVISGLLPWYLLRGGTLLLLHLNYIGNLVFQLLKN